MKVLVVDDSKVMRGIIRKMLGQDGVEVLEAPNGRLALELLSTEAVDCIVSDWNMPGMKGIDLLRCVRGGVARAEVPFIMVTAEALASNVAEAEAAAVSAYLVKPFTAEELWDIIRAHVPDAPTD